MKMIFIFLISLFSLSSFAEELLIMYSGTFDPFHRVHAQEVLGALESFPGSKALILPIRRAPHTPKVLEVGAFQPTFLSFDEIVNLARASVAGSPRVSVDLGFEVFEGVNSGIAQAEATKKIKGSNKAHLIGTDILTVWEQKGFLELMLQTANIIVSADPTDLALYEAQKKKYESNPKIKFINVVTESVRSTDLRLKSLSNQPERWIEYLARPAIDDIRSDRLSLNANGKLYIEKMRAFANQLFEYRFFPILKLYILDENLIEKLGKDEIIRLKLVNYLYARTLERKSGSEYMVSDFKSLDSSIIRDLESNIDLRNGLIDAARTIKALRVLFSSVAPVKASCLVFYGI